MKRFILRDNTAPRGADDAGAAAHIDPPELMDARPARVLIVEERADLAASIGNALADIGVDSWSIGGTASAMEAANDTKPGIFLIHVSALDDSAYELARILRRHPDFGETHLIALADVDDEIDADRACEAGFNGHLVGEFDTGAFLEMLSCDVPSCESA